MAEMTEKEMEEARRRGEEYQRTVDCVVDTVSTRDVNGAYNSINNGIKLKYVRDGNYTRDASQSLGTLVHEQKHRDNQMNGMYAYPVSSDQAYKLAMHDEISANMASLVALRQKYLETGDISVFDECGSSLRFYKEAIEKGEINPNSDDPAEFEKEMRLIVNGTQKMWQEKWATEYIDQCSAKSKYRGDHEGKYAAYWDENYQNALKIAYNIGGIDFTKYMDKDVEIPEQGKIIQEAIKRNRDFSDNCEPYNPDGPHTYEVYDSISDSYVTFKADNAEEYYEKMMEVNPHEKSFISELPPYEGNMSIEQYHKYLQHYLTVREFQNEVISGDLQEQARESGKDIKEIYQEKYQEAFDRVQEKYGDLIDVATDKAAIDWNHRLENGQGWNPIPSNDSGEFDYNLAVNSLYEQSLGTQIAQGKEKTLSVGEAVNRNEDFMRPLPKYARTVQDKAEGIEPSWWDKLKNKVKSWGVETEIRDLESKENIKVGFWKGVKNKISGWFKDDDKSPEKVQEVVSNEITHEINTNAPEYPKWKDEEGYRVSDVQYRTIPDLTRPIIKQPLKSNADNQQNNENSECSSSDKMKKAQVTEQTKSKSTSGNDKSTLKNTIKQDAKKANNVSRNIGKQKTITKKVAKVGYKGPTQIQMLKGLYNKVFGE